jgi:holliday junction DNA helicase RuvA
MLVGLSADSGDHMIGYLSGKYLSSEDGNLILDVNGVGYSVLVSSRISMGLKPGASIELYIHTNLRENALELFGFSNSWEKKVFQALTSVSGVGPRTALAVMGGLEAEILLSAILREDRATLGSVSGIGKKTAERLIVELGDKARKLLAERPVRAGGASVGVAEVPTTPLTTTMTTKSDSSPVKGRGKNSTIPAQGASALNAPSGVDIADLWNEAVTALANLGYRESDAITAIRMASAKVTEAGEAVTLERLIKSTLQLMSRGAGK